MLATLLAAGAIPEATAAQLGPFIVPDERLAVAAKIQGTALIATAIPLGAAEWAQPFDPGDHRPYGISFDDVLDDADTIKTIDRVAMSPAAAALGVVIDDGSNRPVIDAEGKRRIQLWFEVTDGLQEGASFDAAGVRLPVAFRITTDKGQRVERSAVLTVRQL